MGWGKTDDRHMDHRKISQTLQSVNIFRFGSKMKFTFTVLCGKRKSCLVNKARVFYFVPVFYDPKAEAWKRLQRKASPKVKGAIWKNEITV